MRRFSTLLLCVCVLFAFNTTVTWAQTPGSETPPPDLDPGGGGGGETPGNETPGNETPGNEDPGNENPGGGGDNGGGDNGGSGDSGDKPSQREPKAELKWSVAPVLYFDFDFSSRLINLRQQHVSLNSHQPVMLELDRDGAGYIYSYEGTLDAGIGAALIGKFENASGIKDHLEFSLGIVPIMGSEYKVQRWTAMNDRETLRALKSTPIPYKADDLDNWLAGDTLSYAGRGGLFGFAGVGAGLISVSVSGWEMCKGGRRMSAPLACPAKAAIEGDWAISVTKLNTHEVMLKLFKTEIRGGALSVGALFQRLGWSEFTNLENGLTFVFDLRNAEARAAYEAMIQGDLSQAQLLSLAKGKSAVQHMETYNQEQIKNQFGVYFGIPYLVDVVAAKGTLMSFSDSHYHQSGRQVKQMVSGHLKQTDSRFMLNKESVLKGFYASRAQTIEPSQRPGSVELSAQMEWRFQNESSIEPEVSGAIRRMIRNTGFDKELGVVLPEYKDQYNQHKSLGYVDAHVVITFSDQATREILATSSGAKDNFEKETGRLIQGYFGPRFEDPLSVCYQYNPDSSIVKTGSSFNEGCSAWIKKETNAALADMFKAIGEMNQNYALQQHDNGLEFTRAYARFGKAMMTNMFSFKAGMAMVKSAPVSMDFVVQGEKVSRYMRRFDVVNGRAKALNVTAFRSNYLPGLNLYIPKVLHRENLN